MFAVELAAPIDDNITTVYVGNYIDDGTALTVNCIVERNPYREEFIPLWSGEVYQKMSGYTEEDIANSIRDYYGNDRNLVEPSYSVANPGVDWPAFNFYLFSNAEFIAYGLALQAVNPYLVPALVERYGQIAKIGLTASDFASYWNYFCQLGQVTLEHRESWATMAESFNLPSEFVTVVRGT